MKVTVTIGGVEQSYDRVRTDDGLREALRLAMACPGCAVEPLDVVSDPGAVVQLDATTQQTIALAVCCRAEVGTLRVSYEEASR